jgi:hypothetical protein
MKDDVYKFLGGVLGADGAEALKRAAGKEPSLEPLLVPRAAMAWALQKHDHEGTIPGIPNSYLKFKKHGHVWSGTVSVDDSVYSFENASIEHVGAALGVAVGMDLKASPVPDRTLSRLGKSIDALVKAQDLVRKIIEPASSYRITDYTVEHEDTGKIVTFVKAEDRSGQVVAQTAFVHVGEGLHAGPSRVLVSGKGLAKAMAHQAESSTGKKVEGQALDKVDLPGTTAKPQKQLEPIGPIAPTKQPANAAAAKPKLPKPPKLKKIPSLRIGKSEASAECQACGGQMFVGNRFKGCICLQDLSKSVKTTVYGDGYVLEFATGTDFETARAVVNAIKGDA